jgi:hypothetical protein
MLFLGLFAHVVSEFAFQNGGSCQLFRVFFCSQLSAEAEVASFPFFFPILTKQQTMSTPLTIRNIGGLLLGTPPTTPAGLPGPTVAKLAVATAGALNSLARTVPTDSFRIKRAL